jgi:hypothetical protein
MAVTNFSPLLGLALPTTGDLSGTWGTTVNDAITSLIDSAVAGTTTLSTDANVTLTTTNGAANQARNAVLLCTGARTAIRTITAPAQSKAYIVINDTTGGFAVKIVGSGPTAGVTISNGEKVLLAWNGSDFVVVVSSFFSGVSTFSGGTTGLTPSSATTGAITLAGTLVTANGGTGNANGTVAKLATTNFSIEESGGKLVFKYGATTIASMTSAGVFTALSNITGNGTP